MTQSPFEPHLAARDHVLLDGGLASQLELEGHDLDHALWSARLLADDPDAIERAHWAPVASVLRGGLAPGCEQRLSRERVLLLEIALGEGIIRALVDARSPERSTARYIANLDTRQELRRQRELARADGTRVQLERWGVYVNDRELTWRGPRNMRGNVENPWRASATSRGQGVSSLRRVGVYRTPMVLPLLFRCPDGPS